MASLAPKGGTISFEQAKHISSRLFFGATRSEIDGINGQNATNYIDSLFSIDTNVNLPIDPQTGETWVINGRTDENSSNFVLRRITRAWFTDLMIKDYSIQEKLVWFLNTHFTTNAQAFGSRTKLIYHQNQLFRLYALGSFKTLAHKICRDCAMQFFLDGFSNQEGNPNENFAREFLELYTIGKGEQVGPGDYTTYTEDDIREAAKVLTGYRYDYNNDVIDPDTGLLRSYIQENRHDTTDKQFSYAFQHNIIEGEEEIPGIEDELQQLIDMIFSQLATAENIVRKLYRFFVYPVITDEVEDDIITPLAEQLLEDDYILEGVLKTLLKSEHFFCEDDADVSNDIIGGIIKSPIQLTSHTTKFFKVQFPPESNVESYVDEMVNLDSHTMAMDLILFEPHDTAGWAAYYSGPNWDENWASANTLVARYNFSNRYIDGKKPTGGNMDIEIDIVAYVDDPDNVIDPFSALTIVNDLTDYLFPYGTSESRADVFKAYLVDPNDPDFYWSQEWNNYKSTGDDSVVRSRLEDLLNAILQTAEYMLH
jgi:uncharacterized protein (DUF1800 family)